MVSKGFKTIFSVPSLISLFEDAFKGKCLRKSSRMIRNLGRVRSVFLSVIFWSVIVYCVMEVDLVCSEDSQYIFFSPAFGGQRNPGEFFLQVVT